MSVIVTKLKAIWANISSFFGKLCLGIEADIATAEAVAVGTAVVELTKTAAEAAVDKVEAEFPKAE